MADMLHKNLHYYSSSPSNFSPLFLSPQQPRFSIFRFSSPLKRKKLPHSSILPKLSSNNSWKFHIISKTENSDGSVVFKFGDASELPPQIAENLDSVNDVEYESEDDNTKVEDVVTDDVSDSTKAENIVVDDDVCDKTMAENLVVTKDDDASDITTKAENVVVVNDASDITKADIVVDDVSDITKKAENVVNDNIKAENVVVVDDVSDINVVTDDVSNITKAEDVVVIDDVSDVTKAETVVADDIKAEDVVDDDNAKAENVVVMKEIENTTDGSVTDLESDVQSGEEFVEDELSNGSVSIAEAEISSDFEGDSGDGVMIEKAEELSEVSEAVSDESKIEDEMSSKVEASDVVVPLEDEIVEQVMDEDEETAEFTSVGFEAEPILDEESSVGLGDDVVVLESSLGSNNKVADVAFAATGKFDDGPCTSDILQGTGPEASGNHLAESHTDSVQISADAFMTPAPASSQDSEEVHDATTLTIAQCDDDLGDILVAAGPATSGITSSETSLNRLNEVEISVPEFYISSAVASLSQPIEALTGGKDAYFVSENWLGVADGVGQWSLEGVDTGLYAHEFMQNCDKLLKSTSAELNSAKDLLQQSAAITQSAGSARVLIAHVDKQVLHVANIGDSGFVIIRNGTVFKKSSPMVHEFSFPYAIGLGEDSVEDVEEYHIELEDGDVIVTATDGLFDNLYEHEIASMVSKSVGAGMYEQDLAELLAAKALEVGRSESARSPFADAAQAAGHPGYSGGKLDHVTVILSLVQRR